MEDSSNDPIRSGQNIRRDRQTDLLGGFQIDDELELLRLLDWQIGWLCLSRSCPRNAARR
jgi:hypothetical protein